MGAGLTFSGVDRLDEMVHAIGGVGSFSASLREREPQQACKGQSFQGAHSHFDAQAAEVDARRSNVALFCCCSLRRMDPETVESARARLNELSKPGQRHFPAMLIEDNALLVERVVSAQAGQRTDGSRSAAAQEDVAAALSLVEEMRDLLERLEVQVVQLAKARRMTWPQIAAAQQHRSPQAATQRYQRLVTRLAEREGALVADFPAAGGRNA